MTHSERLHAALDTADSARALRAVVLALAAEGYAKRDIIVMLEALLLDLRERGADEDAVLDSLDALAGWCHVDHQLLPERKP